MIYLKTYSLNPDILFLKVNCYGSLFFLCLPPERQLPCFFQVVNIFIDNNFIILAFNLEKLFCRNLSYQS
ncbi:MAG TPA: hypothetical protein ACFYDZ_10850, partial [Candidatus Brocadiaceae bacterium]